MTKDPNCIFCKIVAGEIPCAKVHEDDTALAFMDTGPLAEGHVLLIPKEHYQTVDQMPGNVAAECLATLPKLVRAVQVATQCEGVNVLQNNGRVAHQVVPHVHFHIIPRNAGDQFHFNWPAGTYGEGQLDALLGKINDALEAS